MIRPEDMDDIALIAEYQRWAILERGSHSMLSELEASRLRLLRHEFKKRMQEDEEERAREAEEEAERDISRRHVRALLDADRAKQQA